MELERNEAARDVQRLQRELADANSDISKLKMEAVGAAQQQGRRDGKLAAAEERAILAEARLAQATAGKQPADVVAERDAAEQNAFALQAEVAALQRKMLAADVLNAENSNLRNLLQAAEMRAARFERLANSPGGLLHLQEQAKDAVGTPHEAAQLRTINAALGEQVASLQDLADREHTALQAVQKQLVEAKQRAAADGGRLEGENEALRDQLLRMHDRNAQLVNSVPRDTQLQTARHERDDMECALLDLQRAQAELNAQLAKAKRQLADAAQQQEDDDARIDALTRKCERLQQAKATPSASSAARGGAAAAAAGPKGIDPMTVDALHDEIDKLTIDNKSLAAKVKALEEICAEYEGLRNARDAALARAKRNEGRSTELYALVSWGGFCLCFCVCVCLCKCVCVCVCLCVSVCV